MTPSTATSDETPLADRGANRSRRPQSRAFLDFVTSGWGERPPSGAVRDEVAGFTAARRERLSGMFPGVRLVIPAGEFRVRSNDCDYRFRPHSAFAHLTGLGGEQEPDAVLVLHPTADGHDAVLYMRPAAGRDTTEFFSDSRYGEFWVGARPTLEDLATSTGITTAHLDDLPDAIAKDAGAGGVRIAAISGVDSAIDAIVAAVSTEQTAADAAATASDPDHRPLSDALIEAVSELRLIKDDWEITQLREAIAATADGFDDVIRSLPRAIAHSRGERVVEGAFIQQARIAGNYVGYETIAASGEHATTLHWTNNDGAVRPGDLILVDAGVEAESLYTADITRTLPINGTFTDVQRRIYQAVLDAADAAFAAAKPGARFTDVHDAAMVVIAERLAEWGLLPVSAEQSLSPEGQQHRRWMVHGTSHHLGLDVHDCAQARAEMYLGATIKPGMVFTIEPGLYFKADDLLVPAEYRGIGVRIEDDILITADGAENLSAALPRDPDAVESWLARLIG